MEEPATKGKERKSLREFGLTVGIAFGVLAALLFWREKAHYIYFVPVSAALILLGLIVPLVLRPIRKGWMAMAAALGVGLGWALRPGVRTEPPGGGAAGPESPSTSPPPRPGVTPATTRVPYSTACRVWKVPASPVIP